MKSHSSPLTLRRNSLLLLVSIGACVAALGCSDDDSGKPSTDAAVTAAADGGSNDILKGETAPNGLDAMATTIVDSALDSEQLVDTSIDTGANTTLGDKDAPVATLIDSATDFGQTQDGAIDSALDGPVDGTTGGGIDSTIGGLIGVGVDATSSNIEIAGTWLSNFGDHEEITDTNWDESLLAEYDNSSRVAYTQSPADDPYTPSKFNKIVWTALVGDSFYYCTADYGLDTLAAAKASTKSTDSSAPDTSGCGGFSWTKLTRL